MAQPDRYAWLCLVIFMLFVGSSLASSDIIIVATPPSLKAKSSDLSINCTWSRDRGTHFRFLMSLVLLRAEIPGEEFRRVASVTSYPKSDPDVISSLGAEVRGQISPGGRMGYISFRWPIFADLGRGDYMCKAYGTNDNCWNCIGVCPVPLISSTRRAVKRNDLGVRVDSGKDDELIYHQESTLEDNFKTSSDVDNDHVINEDILDLPYTIEHSRNFDPSLHIDFNEVNTLDYLTTQIMFVNTSKTIVDLRAQLSEHKERIEVQESILQEQMNTQEDAKIALGKSEPSVRVQQARLDYSEAKLAFQRSVNEDQTIQLNYNMDYNTKYRPPAFTLDSVGHQRSLASMQETYFTEARVRNDDQLSLMDEQISRLHTLTSVLNTTTYSFSLAPDEASYRREKLDMLDEHLFLLDQKGILQQSTVRLDYNDALVADHWVQINILTKNLKRPPVSNFGVQQREMLMEDVDDLEGLLRRIDGIVVHIDTNVRGLETLIVKSASRTFDPFLFEEEKMVLVQQKANYINQNISVRQHIVQLQESIATLPVNRDTPF